MGCGSSKCGGSCGCSCSSECTEICTALEVSNSWNVPSCGNQAVLSVPGAYNVLIGSYIWNPTYGWFKITAFDSVNRQITVLNECLSANATPGTVVPSDTIFVFGAPPGATTVTFSINAAGTAYTLTTSTANYVFGTTNPEITITQPGTYLILGGAVYSGSALTSSGSIGIQHMFRRTNNTPTVFSSLIATGLQAVGVASTWNLGQFPITPALYTTLNSNDVITIAGFYGGGMITAGSLIVDNAYIRAIKLY